MFEDMLPEPEASENTQSVTESAGEPASVTDQPEETPQTAEESARQKSTVADTEPQPKKDSRQIQLF